MIKALRIYHRNGYDGVMIPDHTPQMTCAGPWHAGMAYALGYMSACIALSAPRRITAHDERRNLPAAGRPDRGRGRRRRGSGDRSPHRAALLGRHPRGPALRERPRLPEPNTSRTFGTIVGAAAPRQHNDGFAVAVADGLAFWSDGQLTVADPVLPEAASPHERRQVRLARTPVGRQHAHGVRARRRCAAPLGRPLTQRHGGHRIHPPERARMEPRRTRPCTSSTASPAPLLAAPYDADDGQVGDFAPLCRVDAGPPRRPRRRRRRLDLDRGLGRLRDPPLQQRRRTHRDRAHARHASPPAAPSATTARSTSRPPATASPPSNCTTNPTRDRSSRSRQRPAASRSAPSPADDYGDDERLSAASIRSSRLSS